MQHLAPHLPEMVPYLFQCLEDPQVIEYNGVGWKERGRKDGERKKERGNGKEKTRKGKKDKRQRVAK